MPWEGQILGELGQEVADAVVAADCSACPAPAVLVKVHHRVPKVEMRRVAGKETDKYMAYSKGISQALHR